MEQQPGAPRTKQPTGREQRAAQRWIFKLLGKGIRRLGEIDRFVFLAFQSAFDSFPDASARVVRRKMTGRPLAKPFFNGHRFDLRQKDADFRNRRFIPAQENRARPVGRRHIDRGSNFTDLRSV